MADILIVEDDRAILRGLEENLVFEGHRVRHLLRGDEAPARVAAERPDLLILDVMLPGLSGFEVCRRIRRTDRHLPILMLTARGEDVDKVMGLDLGADDYLTKPYSRHELRARVRALLRRAAPTESAEIYRFADVEVDFARAEVRRGGERVDLTPLEFKLMATFVKSRGRVFTRQQLLDAAWGRDLAVTERVVDNQILNLRRKVEPDPVNPRYIAGVRGIGYRFDG